MLSYIVSLSVIALSSVSSEPPVIRGSNGYYQGPPLLPTVSNMYASPSDSYGAPIRTQEPPAASYGPPMMSAPQETIIHKHVYVHVAPPEPEVEPQRQPIMMMQPIQKHYKIVFIKAPTPPAPKLPIIAPPVQNEEKTLVYVLVKKPEEQAPIELPTQPPTIPSKPEVYFIRYKTKAKQQEGSAGEGYPNSVAPPKTSYGSPNFEDLARDYAAPDSSGAPGSKY